LLNTQAKPGANRGINHLASLPSLLKYCRVTFYRTNGPVAHGPSQTMSHGVLDEVAPKTKEPTV
jgi:hypothetical protein